MRTEPARNAGAGGRLVGRYLVHERIAAGGMATVHLGRLLGPAGFSRTVAIKRLHDGYARDPDFVAMLLDEARLAATIRHPNVVPSLDVVAEGGELFIVMEYVEGDSLAHLSKVAFKRRQRIPSAFAVAMIVQVLHGLHAAHEARDKNGEHLGIVHRDVSPQNILVGVDGIARVLDFGIAKAASRATATEGGKVKGKAAFMAPEQLQHGAVDRRADVFAAAVCLWELLASRRLFVADSREETMAQVLNKPVEPPQKFEPDVPAALGAIVLRGLERDVDRRFATAEEMAQALEDAVRMPRAKDVGAWVSEIAAAELAARAELVQVVERSSHRLEVAQATTDPELRGAIEEAERRRHVTEMATDVGGNMPGTPGGAPPPDVAAVPSSELTQLSTVNTSHAFTPPARVSRASMAIGLAGAIALLIALGVAFMATRAANAPANAPVATPPSPPASPEPTLAPAPVIAEPAAPPPPVVSASVAPAAPPPAPAKATSGRRGTKKPACEGVPWEVDANGLKHFKVECL